PARDRAGDQRPAADVPEPGRHADRRRRGRGHRGWRRSGQSRGRRRGSGAVRRRAGLVPTALALVVTAAGCGHARVAGPTLRPRWRWSAPSPASVGMPAADAVGVAATYGHRALVLLDGAGNLRWQVEHVGVRDVAPRFVGPLVLVATDDGLAAFGRGDGHRLWEASLGDRASTPTVVGGRPVVTLWGGALVAVDLLDGHQAWRQPLPGPALGPPAGDAGVVVATWETEGGHGGMVAVDADGRVQWSVSLPGGGVGGPAAAAGVAVAVAGDSQAHGVDVTTGRERWHAATGGAGSPEVPPLVVGPDVLVADRLGGLTTLRAAPG